MPKNLHHFLPFLLLALCLSTSASAQTSDTTSVPAATAPRTAPAKDSAGAPDPFVQARSEQTQARWILAYGALFAAAVGFLVWRQQK